MCVMLTGGRTESPERHTSYKRRHAILRTVFGVPMLRIWRLNNLCRTSIVRGYTQVFTTFRRLNSLVTAVRRASSKPYLPTSSGCF